MWCLRMFHKKWDAYHVDVNCILSFYSLSAFATLQAMMRDGHIVNTYLCYLSMGIFFSKIYNIKPFNSWNLKLLKERQNMRANRWKWTNLLFSSR